VKKTLEYEIQKKGNSLTRSIDRIINIVPDCFYWAGYLGYMTLSELRPTGPGDGKGKGIFGSISYFVGVVSQAATAGYYVAESTGSFSLSTATTVGMTFAPITSRLFHLDNLFLDSFMVGDMPYTKENIEKSFLYKFQNFLETLNKKNN